MCFKLTERVSKDESVGRDICYQVLINHSSISRHHVVEGENGGNKLSSDLHVNTTYVYTHTHTQIVFNRGISANEIKHKMIE